MAKRPAKAASARGTETRNAYISEDRLRIEKLLKRTPHGETLSLAQISEKTGISKPKTSQIMQSLRIYSIAVNLSNNPGQGKWCATGKSKATGFKTAPSDPVKNGNQPNGSAIYWQGYTAQLTSTARAIKPLPATPTARPRPC